MSYKPEKHKIIEIRLSANLKLVDDKIHPSIRLHSSFLSIIINVAIISVESKTCLYGYTDQNDYADILSNYALIVHFWFPGRPPIEEILEGRKKKVIFNCIKYDVEFSIECICRIKQEREDGKEN